jgi:F0F1-type ATP synthase assembly protein I
LFRPRKDRSEGTPRELVPTGSLKALQTTISRSGPAATVSYTLIGAIVLLGGIGYALDEWRGTSPWFLFGGLVLGLIVGFYELAKTIWRK